MQGRSGDAGRSQVVVEYEVSVPADLTAGAVASEVAALDRAVVRGKFGGSSRAW